MINIYLSYIHCDEETNEVGNDEPYILAVGVALTPSIPGVPVQAPLASDVVVYPFQEMETDGRARWGVFESFWGVGGSSAALANPDDAIFVVAMMENDNGDPQIARGLVDTAVNVSLIESLALTRPGKVTTLMHDVDSARRLPTGGPNFDDAIGAPQELRFTADELRLAEFGQTITKTMVFQGDGGQYTLMFDAHNPGTNLQGILYALAHNNDLLWYRHDGRMDGSFRWAFNEGKKVGNQWDFKQIFSGGDGILYAIAQNNDLLWYRHDGQGDGSFRWGFDEGKKVGHQWDFEQVFYGGDGIIYALAHNNDLLWYRHDGRLDGSFRWGFDEGKKVGHQWDFKQIFYGGDGIIYALAHNNDLLWYRHDGRFDGSFRWAFDEGKKVGNQWNFEQIFYGGDGILYALTHNNDLLWYRHDGRLDGSFRWAFDEGKKVGHQWNFKQVFPG